MIIRFNKYRLNENIGLSGKHSFLMFLQIISNHDFHFILNDQYTKLYQYHLLFSSETIKDVDKYVEIFKYKHSLAACTEILSKIKENKISFFFGIKGDNTLRYGFMDLDSQRSYVAGEFVVTGEYFKSVSKYKALQYINKYIQNLNVKNLATLTKIKNDFDNFYKTKKNLRVKIVDNRVINYFSRELFTDEDIKMNRLYRALDEWVSKKSWREKVEYSVNDEGDPIEFIIIVKK